MKNTRAAERGGPYPAPLKRLTVYRTQNCGFTPSNEAVPMSRPSPAPPRTARTWNESVTDPSPKNGPHFTLRGTSSHAPPSSMFNAVHPFGTWSSKAEGCVLGGGATLTTTLFTLSIVPMNGLPISGPSRARMSTLSPASICASIVPEATGTRTRFKPTTRA